MIVLGIDAGASKTHAVLANEKGTVLGTGRAGSANWEFVELEGAREALQSAINQAVTGAGIKTDDISAAGFGLAGLDWPSDEERLQPVIDSLGVGGPCVMVNDAFLPLRAGTADGVGLAAIAGTGATVVGRNQAGTAHRSFGAGYPFTDWGGAGDLVSAAVHAVALAYKKMGPETVLTARMLESTGCGNAEEMLEKIMRWQVVIGGEFAPQVVRTAGEGDPAAAAIVKRAGEAIGENVLAVATRLDMLDTAFDLVTAGGVFSSQSPLLDESLLQTVRSGAPKVRRIHWSAPPVVGAMLLAFDLMKPDRLPETGFLAENVTQSLESSSGE